MSKARDEYYNYITYIHKDSHITNYVEELEADTAELLKIVLEFAGFMNEKDRKYILKKYKVK